MGKSIYILFLVGGSLSVFLSGVTVIAADGGFSPGEIAPVILSAIVLGAIAHLKLVYKFWKSIKNGRPHMTPLKAIACLFFLFSGFYAVITKSLLLLASLFLLSGSIGNVQAADEYASRRGCFSYPEVAMAP